MFKRGPLVMVGLAVLSVVGISLGGVAVAGGGSGVALEARMSGAKELQAADPDGRGRVSFAIDVAAGQVCYDLTFRRIGTPNRGHIHVGDAMTNGGIVVTLFELASAPADPRHDALEQHALSECVTAPSETLAAIVANPGGYYANFHNARFPSGAIRGQLQTSTA